MGPRVCDVDSDHSALLASRKMERDGLVAGADGSLLLGTTLHDRALSHLVKLIGFSTERTCATDIGLPGGRLRMVTSPCPSWTALVRTPFLFKVSCHPLFKVFSSLSKVYVTQGPPQALVPGMWNNRLGER